VSVGVYIFYLYTSALDGRTSEKRDIYIYSMSVGWVGGWVVGIGAATDELTDRFFFSFLGAVVLIVDPRNVLYQNVYVCVCVW
jgi:hypothetical protein